MPLSSFKITRGRIDNGALISGKLAVAALMGQFVARKDPAAATGITSTHLQPEFELATGKRGYALTRDVLNLTEHTLSTLIEQDADFLTPTLVNQVATAREVEEGEYEGSDFLVLAGAQAISSGTAINTPLTLSGGKLALKTGGLLEKVADGRNGAGAITLTGARVADTVLRVVKLSDLEKRSLGRNGAGALTLAGTRVGDKVRTVVKESDGTDLSASFEATITVAGQIQQSSATDLSAVNITFSIDTPAAVNVAADFEAAITVADQIQQSSAVDLTTETFLFFVETPSTGQQTVFRLTGQLAVEDSDNTVRIRVEKV